MAEKLEFNEIEITGIKRITEKAVLVGFDDGAEKWIPRSNISYRDDIEVDGKLVDYDKTSLRVVRWFCEQEGI